jgi:16S rRNA (adenine1518-N6/adenine1519-N6)-dimethyltransferase
MAGYDGLPPLREVIARHGLTARKRLGQNFLFDLNLTDKIARAGGPLDDLCVIEVGPGPGGLTRALLHNGARKVVVIEQDERCIGALQEIAAANPGRLEIHQGDALNVTMSRLAKGSSCVISNLPYNVSTALFTGWLTEPAWPPWFRHLTLMFQREVADRIVAAPGGKNYGRLSVLAQWRGVPRKLFDIDARAFTPPPKVTSTLIHLEPKPDPRPHCAVKMLETVTAAAFGQRRKMLRSSLKTLLADPAQLLTAANIPGELRAEQVDVEGFGRLAACFEDIERDRGLSPG